MQRSVNAVFMTARERYYVNTQRQVSEVPLHSLTLCLRMCLMHYLRLDWWILC